MPSLRAFVIVQDEMAVITDDITLINNNKMDTRIMIMSETSNRFVPNKKTVQSFYNNNKKEERIMYYGREHGSVRYGMQYAIRLYVSWELPRGTIETAERPRE